MSEAGGVSVSPRSLAKSGFRHRELVGGNGQAAFGDMKYPLSGATVTARVVQHALFDPIGVNNLGGQLVAIRRQ